MSGINLGKDYKITEEGKVVKNECAIEARLDVSTRLKRRNSKKQTYKPAGRGKS